MAGKKPVGADKKEQNKPASKTVKKKPTKTKNIKKQYTKKQSQHKPISTLKTTVNEQKKIKTHDGYNLSSLQARFIDLYIELGNQRQACIQAGYKCKNPDYQANALLRTPKIIGEINWRMEQMHKKSIASAEEIMEFYTKVMRGEEKDQFGLDAPLSERIKAGNELAKRLVDIPNKLEGKGQATVTIALDWTGMEESKENTDDEQGELGKT